jgi:hypothetical protein
VEERAKDAALPALTAGSSAACLDDVPVPVVAVVGDDGCHATEGLADRGRRPWLFFSLLFLEICCSTDTKLGMYQDDERGAMSITVTSSSFWCV